MDNLNLADPKDCPVLAAEIKINANLIGTDNLKDFPEKLFGCFGLKVKSADDFLTDPK
jgi:predicted nucleic acid-binding protein